ncbi:hypothetical protein D3C81_1168400 [compost metagenome]
MYEVGGKHRRAVLRQVSGRGHQLQLELAQLAAHQAAVGAFSRAHDGVVAFLDHVDPAVAEVEIEFHQRIGAHERGQHGIEQAAHLRQADAQPASRRALAVR